METIFMTLNKISILTVLVTTLTLTGCGTNEIKQTQVDGIVAFMDKSPYHLTLFENFFGGDLIKLQGNFYTLVNAEGYINEGSKVKMTMEGDKVIQVCQILTDELQQFRKCFRAQKV